MPGGLLPGPYRILQLGSGTTAPWYIIPFDRQGRCEAPATREQLLYSVQQRQPSDVYLFSHGWNNAWKKAVERYDHFVAGYSKLRQDWRLEPGRPYRPLLVGIFWPSATLVLPWERAPAFAGDSADPGRQDETVEQERREVEEIAAELHPEDVERFYQLTQHASPLPPAELAEMLAPLYRTANEEQPAEPQPPSPNELLELWTSKAEDEDADRLRDFGTIDGGPGQPLIDAAGLVPGRLPFGVRDIIRQTTVWLMKDRAGTVGSRGVAPLLADLLKASDARLHLVGHSYGCKVQLSAICALPPACTVDSLLLLQPAVNYLCFAKDATGSGQPGGYRTALRRVDQPVLSTYSSHDLPLRWAFHRFVRRRSDLGEARIAGAPPSRYAALGGYGPGGIDGESREIPILPVGEPYDLGPGAPDVYGIDASTAIGGHGDVSTPATWWALYSQVAAGRA